MFSARGIVGGTPGVAGGPVRRADPGQRLTPFGDFVTCTPSTSPCSLREHTRVGEGAGLTWDGQFFAFSA
jgi:hypothetical protein